jgi:hypothetical protein
MTAMMLSRIPLVLMLFAFLASATGCRDGPLCARTVRSTCICDDPTRPGVRTCVAYVEVPSCNADADPPDVCLVNPCCRLAQDAGLGDAKTPGDAAGD